MKEVKLSPDCKIIQLLTFDSNLIPSLATTLGSLSNNDSDGYENVIYKVKPHCFKLDRTYSMSFNSSNVGNIFWTWVLKDCIEVQEKKRKVVALSSRPP